MLIMAIYAIIAKIISLYYVHTSFALLNTFVFSLVSFIIGTIMLSSWTKKERTYNYKFGED